METLVSIIIPTYNRADILKKSIDSILDQIYPDFELLIIDDCSTDRTKEMVENIPDQRIRYLRLEENKGPSYARNMGIQAAKGDFIAFQDSDDFWKPDKLEKQMQIIQRNPELGAVYCTYTKIYEDGRTEYVPSKDERPKEGNLYETLLATNLIGTPTLLVRRECIDRCGMFDAGMKALEDWDFILRIAKDYPIGYIEKSLVDSPYSSDGVNSNEANKISALCSIILKYKEDMLQYQLLASILSELVHYCVKNDPSYLDIVKSRLIPGVLEREWELDCIVLEAKSRQKFMTYYHILLKMSEMDDLEAYLNDYFAGKSWSKIAVYGMGGIGKALLKVLLRCNIEIMYGIDKKAGSGSHGVEVRSMDQIQEEPDAIILTVPSEISKITEGLRHYTNCPIIPITELIGL